MSETMVESQFKPWTKKTIVWAFLCFLILSCINGLFSFIFDVLLFNLEMGYVYFYFCFIFFTLTLYFFYEKFKVNWFGTFSFGLMGLIGIGIEYWLEYSVNPVLKSPWGAVGWGGIYIIYGLSADLSLYLLKIIKSRLIAFSLSSIIFSLTSILISIIPLKLFYIPSPEGTKSFLTYWYILIPYAIIQAVMGSLLGYFLANLSKNTGTKTSEELN